MKAYMEAPDYSPRVRRCTDLVEVLWCCGDVAGRLQEYLLHPWLAEGEVQGTHDGGEGGREAGESGRGAQEQGEAGVSLDLAATESNRARLWWIASDDLVHLNTGPT